MGKWSFWGQFKLQKNCNKCSSKILFNLVEITFGLVRASYSLPKWQAVKLTFIELLKNVGNADFWGQGKLEYAIKASLCCKKKLEEAQWSELVIPGCLTYDLNEKNYYFLVPTKSKGIVPRAVLGPTGTTIQKLRVRVPQCPLRAKKFSCAHCSLLYSADQQNIFMGTKQHF